ncbi:Sec-independent protein translocase protein TatB [Rhodanobacter sp. Col0626]|uniref:Sec-independent protein translocase protein TatB n=1 Tax=Rhodanobacter sp. Col0626 TaxID=3415679 RepID=UPI003CFA9F08
MIEISLGKLVLLALIALIVLGPEKLPGAARTAGALLRRVRSGWDNVRAEVERELEIEEIRRTARAAAAQAEAAQNEVRDGVRQMHEPLSKTAEEIAALVKPEPSATIAAELVAPELAAVDDAPVDHRQAELPLGEPSPLSGKAPHDQA